MGAAEVAVLALQLRVQRSVVLRRDVQLGQMLQLQKYLVLRKIFEQGREVPDTDYSLYGARALASSVWSLNFFYDSVTNKLSPQKTNANI